MKNSKEVGRELKNLIKKYKLEKKLSVEKVKRMVFNESGASAMEAVNKFQKKCFSYFSNLEKIDELESIAKVFTDAWNHFPHRSLNGRSPNEIFSPEMQKPLDIIGKKAMPKIIIGGHEMEWDEHEAMLAEMDKRQEPFREWIENEVKPKYRTYLNTTLAKKAADKHFKVADIFFERALYVGFIEFSQIRKVFIQKEFPRWWQAHVLMDNSKEKEIVSSLRKLFEFIEFTFEVEIKKFGF